MKFSKTITLSALFLSSLTTLANAQIAQGQDALMNFAPFILILVIMYFFVFRPQSKRAKEHREMVAELKRGDRVVVANGIFGIVAKVIDDNEISVEVSKGVEITAVRSSVSQVVTKTSTAKPVDKLKKMPAKKTAAKKKASAKSAVK